MINYLRIISHELPTSDYWFLSKSISMAADYYSILDVPRDASQADIQKAYRKKAREHHPDLNPDDEGAKDRFQNVQRAFDVLGDAEQRKLYDRYGPDFEQMAHFQEGAPGGGSRSQWRTGGGGGQYEDIDLSSIFGMGGGGGGGAGFEDILRQFGGGGGGATGGRRRRRRQAETPKGQNLEAEVNVPFTMAVAGGKTDISLRRGDGSTETIAVTVPAGIEDGKKLRLSGKGEPSPYGGASGDILLTIRVQPHPFFTREGENLQVRLPITLPEAAAGAKVDVPTPGGTVTLSIPPGTSSGKKLRIKGHGVPATKKRPAGDLVATVEIILPPELTDKEKENLAALSDKYATSPRADLRF